MFLINPYIFWNSTFHTKAIEFDWTTETLANTTSQAIWVANAHSWVLWLKASSTTQGYPMVIRNYNTDINNIIQIVWSSSKFEVWLYNSAWTNIKKYITSSSYSTNTIYAVGYSRDGTTLTVYVNGASVSITKPADLSWTQTDSNRRIWIWSNVWVNNWFNGIVSKFDLWDTTLPANAFSALYDSWNGYKNDTRNALWNYTQTTNLKHQWALGKDIWSNIWYDYVASGQINISNNSVNITDADIVTF